MRTCSGCRSATRSRGALTMTHRRILVAGGLSLALLAAACHEDELFTPLTPSYKGGAMFTRYVSFGNSITAGFQSFGLNDSLQRLAYPVLLARAMGTTFYYPSINYVPTANLFGCPSPITFIFSNPPTRLGPPAAPPCSLRSPIIPPYLNNVAFPGADVLELLNTNYAPPQPPPSATDAYKLFLLGGRTELQRGGYHAAGDVCDPLQRVDGQHRLVRVRPRRCPPGRGAGSGSAVCLAGAVLLRRAGRVPTGTPDGEYELPRQPGGGTGGHGAGVGTIPLRSADHRGGRGRQQPDARLLGPPGDLRE